LSAEPGPSEADAGDHIRLVDYAALHGVTYQTAYGWVRHGRLTAERGDGKWWVARDAPQPDGRAGAEAHRRTLAAIQARRSPESLLAMRQKAWAAAAAARERRRALGLPLQRARPRRERPPCTICQERPVSARGRCARCFAYWRHYGRERPSVVQRRGPQGPQVAAVGDRS
jgi:hypothetical protein